VDDLEAARPAANLVRTDTRQALCESGPVRSHELDGVTGCERPFAVHDAHCEQAAPVHEQRALRPLVDD
jgi:hypothetical protein